MTLYDPELEKDNCGFGLMAHMRGEVSHKLIRTAISSLARMTHCGGDTAMDCLRTALRQRAQQMLPTCTGGIGKICKARKGKCKMQRTKTFVFSGTCNP